MMETLETLPCEGVCETVTTVQARHECENCGEPSHFKHTWLLKGTRSNPASSAHGRDDCSWCEDAHTFSCRKCYNKTRPPDGYVDCSVFPANKRFSHMFLYKKTVTD